MRGDRRQMHSDALRCTQMHSDVLTCPSEALMVSRAPMFSDPRTLERRNTTRPRSIVNTGAPLIWKPSYGV